MRYHSPDLQVRWDDFGVECIHDLIRYLVSQGLVRLQDISIEAVGAQPFVEVAGLDGLHDVVQSDKVILFTIRNSS